MAIRILERKKYIHQIQGNNYLIKNGWKPTYHKVMGLTMYELQYLFSCVSIKNLRTITYKIKMLLVKYIYKKKV